MTADETFGGFSPNAWVAFFTLALVGVAILQVAIYALWLRTTHRAERAYVYIDGISGLEQFGRDLSPTIQIDVKNSGRTPARILASNVVYWVEREGKRLPRKMPLKQHHLRTMDFWMITGRTLPVTVGFKEPITASEFDDVVAGKRKFFVFGQVLYRDRFQWWKKRYTNFSFVLDLRRPLPIDDPKGGQAFGFSIANDSYNDAN